MSKKQIPAVLAAVLAAGLMLAGCGGSSSPAVPPPPVDTDGDGVPDNADAFPNDATETMDADGDGVGDNADAFPNDPAETADADGNGVGDNADARQAEMTALADARGAAKDAWRAARAALARVAGKQSTNAAAYQLAVNAVADAKEASDAAQAATTSAEAMRHQEYAEAANMAAMGFVAKVVASYEAPALEKAQMAAKDAADKAKKAYDAAMAALAEVEANKADDMASYDMAMAKVMEAKAAYDAAMAASAKAAATSVLTDAKDHQKTAEAELAKAEKANTDAMKYADMVQAAYNKRIADEAETERVALASAKTGAQTAYDAAKMAHDAAAQRLADLEAEGEDGRAKRDDNLEDHVRAGDALEKAMSAYEDAKAANEMAQAATTSADAATHRASVETAKAALDTALVDFAKYANLVEASYTAAQNQRNTDEENRKAEEQRVKDVAAARAAAMKSYMDAKADAEKAEDAARAAEETASGSAGANEAGKAATAARMAANAAKAAHDAITDGMTKAEADAKASEAAMEAVTAKTQYMAAKSQNDHIRTAAAIAEETQRVAGIRAATKAAGRAVKAAETAKNEAEQAAKAAEDARDAAKFAFDKATVARTDSATAKAEYENAKAAATAARSAANAASTAHMMAKAEAEGIDPDGDEEAAETAQGTAERAQGTAETAAGTAETEQGKAETAQMAAETARMTHVLALLKAANPEGEAAQKAMAAEVSEAAGATTEAARTGSGTTASVSWPANVPDDPDTEADETEENKVSITVDPEGSGTGLTLAEDTGKTVTKIAGLTGFNTGYAISQGTRHVIVFTDKEQDDAAVTGAAAVTGREVENVDTTPALITKLGTKVGNTYTGVEFTPQGEPALTGTLTCPSGVVCRVDAATAADGTVTINSIAGYVFTGSRAAKAAVEACDADCQAAAEAYLVFGVWLDTAGDAGAANQQFGAFAGGSAAFTVEAALTGTATYNGAATGVYTDTAKNRVDYFQGDATLTAHFGMAPEDGSADTNLGRVTGMIDDIVAGGESMDDVIHLDAAASAGAGNIEGSGGAFSGTARMGGRMTDPVIGTVSHTYEGTWHGSFRGPEAADEATGADMLPPAAAGTFGVTGTTGEGDDARTRSYVGAFGANRE